MDTRKVEDTKRSTNLTTEGCCAGNWTGNMPNEDKWHVSSFEAVDNVVQAFRRQGYAITEHCSAHYPTAYINFRK